MSNTFQYLPCKEVLLNWFNEEYRVNIEHDIRCNSDFIDSMKEIDRRAKNGAIHYMAIELFYNNNSSEYINNYGDREVYELMPIIAKTIGIDVNELDIEDPNISIAVMNPKEFLQMINIVNNNYMKYANHLRTLIHDDSTFIELDRFGNEELSIIRFLDNDFSDISSHYMPTNFVNHLINIYNSKDYKNN
jgi:hypothetical protein